MGSGNIAWLVNIVPALSKVASSTDRFALGMFGSQGPFSKISIAYQTIQRNQAEYSPRDIGRRRDMDMLSRALLAAAHGVGQCLILAGNAGVGKTRLLAEARHHALAEGFLSLQGNCFEQDMSFPYAVIVDLLRTFLATLEGEALRAALGPPARYTRQVWKAAACHHSQLPEYDRLNRLSNEVFLQFWGCQTFYRALSLVNGGRQVEHDLFEGLR